MVAATFENRRPAICVVLELFELFNGRHQSFICCFVRESNPPSRHRYRITRPAPHASAHRCAHGYVGLRISKFMDGRAGKNSGHTWLCNRHLSWHYAVESVQVMRIHDRRLSAVWPCHELIACERSCMSTRHFRT